MGVVMNVFYYYNVCGDAIVRLERKHVFILSFVLNEGCFFFKIWPALNLKLIKRGGRGKPRTNLSRANVIDELL